MKSLTFFVSLFLVVVGLSGADAVVAADGSAPYKTVQAAINAAPQLGAPGKIWTILIKSGTYPEVVYVQREKRFIRLVGENVETTKITAALHATMIGPDRQPLGTFRTATVQIDADDFSVENLTFENAAGPVGQALAVRVDGDRVVFDKCRFLGWQDTILVNRGRHYFKDCLIVGATDYIFGGATAFFDGCTLRCENNSYITAASTPLEEKYGFVFSHCTVRGSKPEIRTYLGRPWRQNAMTVFIGCDLSEVIRPEGWHNWSKPEREKTVRYAEFGNTGKGADTTNRVAWARQLSAEEAAAFTVEKVLAGNDGWRPLIPAP